MQAHLQREAASRRTQFPGDKSEKGSERESPLSGETNPTNPRDLLSALSDPQKMPMMKPEPKTPRRSKFLDMMLEKKRLICDIPLL